MFYCPLCEVSDFLREAMNLSAILFIMVMSCVLTVYLYRRFRAGKPVIPESYEQEICFEEKPADRKEGSVETASA